MHFMPPLQMLYLPLFDVFLAENLLTQIGLPSALHHALFFSSLDSLFFLFWSSLMFTIWAWQSSSKPILVVLITPQNTIVKSYNYESNVYKIEKKKDFLVSKNHLSWHASCDSSRYSVFLLIFFLVLHALITHS